MVANFETKLCVSVTFAVGVDLHVYVIFLSYIFHCCRAKLNVVLLVEETCRTVRKVEFPMHRKFYQAAVHTAIQVIVALVL